MTAPFIWCEIVCRRCASSTSGRFISGSRIPKSSMAKDAEKAGWKVAFACDGIKDWFCGECIE